jgi:hypothetical protein
MGKKDTLEDLRKYIHTQARQIRTRLGAGFEGQLVSKNVTTMQSKSELARYLWSSQGFQTQQLILEYNDSHIMKIAICGLGEYHVTLDTKLQDLGLDFRIGSNGGQLVATVAAGAVLAALVDQIWDEAQKAKIEDQKPKLGEKYLKCHFCDFTIQKFRPVGNGFVVMVSHLSTEHQDKMAEIEKCIAEDVTESV